MTARKKQGRAVQGKLGRGLSEENSPSCPAGGVQKMLHKTRGLSHTRGRGYLIALALPNAPANQRPMTLFRLDLLREGAARPQRGQTSQRLPTSYLLSTTTTPTPQLVISTVFCSNRF